MASVVVVHVNGKVEPGTILTLLSPAGATKCRIIEESNYEEYRKSCIEYGFNPANPGFHKENYYYLVSTD